MINCEVCGKPALKNVVICSKRCEKVRLYVYKLIDKYFPLHGCSNCWEDLGGRCTDECRKEFQAGREFADDIWSLVKMLL